MSLDFIDLIYQNKAVEGLAVFDANNELLENQLSLHVSKVKVIGKSLYNFKLGLSDAKRVMRGFLIKSESITLLTSVFPDYLIILEVSEGSSLNEVDSKLRSIMMDAFPESLKQAPPVQPTLPSRPVQQTQPVQPTQPIPARLTSSQQLISQPQPILPPGAESVQPLQYAQANPMMETAVVDLINFKDRLSKLLKTVAPLKAVSTMIETSMNQMGIDLTTMRLPVQTATDLGHLVVSKIPNKARREILQKEYVVILNEILA